MSRPAERALKRVYVEITNICNLRCSFCPGTRREKGFLPPEQFHMEQLKREVENCTKLKCHIGG